MLLGKKGMSKREQEEQRRRVIIVKLQNFQAHAYFTVNNDFLTCTSCTHNFALGCKVFSTVCPQDAIT